MTDQTRRDPIDPDGCEHGTPWHEWCQMCAPSAPFKGKLSADSRQETEKAVSNVIDDLAKSFAPVGEAQCEHLFTHNEPPYMQPEWACIYCGATKTAEQGHES